MRQPKEPDAEAADRAFGDTIRKTISERQRAIMAAHGRLAAALGLTTKTTDNQEDNDD